MSCWVVPTIAAEMWNVTVAYVLHCIREGTIPSKAEHGFVFVDMAPGSPVIQPVEYAPRYKPTTFVPVEPDKASFVEKPEDALTDDETEALTMTDWKESRKRAARTRLAPRQLVSAA